MVIENRRTRFLITAVVMVAAIMQILDTTIVTVALPHMQGQLSANTEQIGWVLTSYLISSGIFMPLTGFLTDRLGQKRYLMYSITGFVIASMLSGLAANLDQIVLFRLLQGIAGAGLVPTAQAVLISTYPREEFGRAMAIFGVGAMVGPILGPTVGGYLTEILNWRWIFFINLPVGVLALLGTLLYVPETEKVERRADWIGFLFLVVAVACMQFVLDRGRQNDWFNSPLIQVMTGLSVFGYICLILRNLEMGEHAMLRLEVFRDRNFSLSILIFAIFMFALYGALALRPHLIESLYGYPTLTTGLVLAPRGFAAMVSMFSAGRLINRTGAKPLILIGFILVFIGSWALTWYAPRIDMWWVIWPGLVQGLGLGLVFVPLATITFATLPEKLSAEAAGIRQLGRTIGASIGVSLSSAVFANQMQAAWNTAGGHLTPFSNAVRGFLAPLHLAPDSSGAAHVLGKVLGQQSAFVGMIDAFYMMSLMLLVSLPLLALLKKGVGRQGGGAVAEM